MMLLPFREMGPFKTAKPELLVNWERNEVVPTNWEFITRETVFGTFTLTRSRPVAAGLITPAARVLVPAAGAFVLLKRSCVPPAVAVAESTLIFPLKPERSPERM